MQTQVPPPARTAPRGLSGRLFGGGGPDTDYQPLDTSSLADSCVLVHVYDLGGDEVFRKINRFSTVNDKVLVGGLYHTGVEIYGCEWAFGATEEPGGGIYGAPPRLNPQHTYRATVMMGSTSLTHQEVMTTLEQLTLCWRGTEYNLIHHNCLDFSNAFCIALGVGRMPGWIDRFGRTASNLDHLRTAAAERFDQTKDFVRSVDRKLRNEDAFPQLSESVQAGAEALSAEVSRWSQDLFGALSKVLGDDQQSREKKGGALRDSLRNRGGITRPKKLYSGGEPPAVVSPEVSSLQPAADAIPERCTSQKMSKIQSEEDVFLLAELPPVIAIPESEARASPPRALTPETDWTMVE